MKITIEITSQTITELMVSAIETPGATDWLHKLAPREEWKGSAPWYADAAFFDQAEFGFAVWFDLADLPEGNNKGKRIIHNREVILGLQAMANEASFADMLTGNIDMITADVFMQCIIYGKVIYG